MLAIQNLYDITRKTDKDNLFNLVLSPYIVSLYHKYIVSQVIHNL